MAYYDAATQALRLLSLVQEREPDHPHPKSRMAELCDISQSAVYQWFSGTGDPRGIHVGMVCKEYYENPNNVFQGEECKVAVPKPHDHEESSSTDNHHSQPDQDTHNYNQSYSFQDKQHRDALGNAVHEGVKLGNAP